MLGDASPFTDSSSGYIYRKWDLAGTPIISRCARAPLSFYLLFLTFTRHDAVRCELSGVQYKDKQPETLLIKALHEYNAAEWTKKFEASRASIYATQCKNSNATVARWVTSALLADAAQLKLG